MTTFSENLRRFRTARHLTQEQAAAALKTSPQSISRWETGATLPDVTLLPEIARLYAVTIDDLYQQNSPAYDNYAQCLGSRFEATLKPEDFLSAELEYRKFLFANNYHMEDLRLYGILYQQMLLVCKQRAEELFNRALEMGKETDPETYWRTRRQKCYFLWELGRNKENIAEFLPLVEGGSENLEEWICLIQAYTFDKDFENVSKWVQEAEKRFGEDATLHIYAGNLCQASKQYPEAFAHWKRALELEPQWMDAAYAMAECYEELGEYAQAARVYRRIADDLERRGFEAEVNWPRILAHTCREKASQP